MANPDIRIANNGISFFEYVLACVPSRAPTSMWNNPVPRYIYEKLNLRITMTVILTSQPALLRTCIELQVYTNQRIPTIKMTSHAALWIPELLEQILLNTDMCTLLTSAQRVCQY